MGILSIENIKSANDIKDETIFIPEWNGEVVVRALTIEERRNLREVSKEFNQKSGKIEIDADKFDVMTVIIGCRNPEFSITDYLWLKEKSAGAIMRIARHIGKKSGMLPESEEEIIKNSKDQSSEISSNLQKEGTSVSGRKA